MIWFAFGTAVLFVFTFLGFVALLPLFFEGEFRRVYNTKKILQSLVVVFILSFALSSLTVFFPTSFWADRIQHAIGGAGVLMLTWYLALKAASISVSRPTFFVLGFLIVTTLGVGYELLEFLGEMTTSFVFQTSQYDTWLDLLSNTVGALVSGAILMQLISEKEKIKNSR